MNKKASATHIEMIISFIIFIGFLLFLLIIFNPFKKSSINESALNLLEESLKNTQIPVNETTIVLNQTSGNYPFISSKGCFYIYTNQQNKIIVKDKDQNFINASLITQAGAQSILPISFKEEAYYLYFSNNFEEQGSFTLATYSSCQIAIPLPTNNDYSFSLFFQKHYFFNASLLEFNRSYYQDYQALKSSLNLSTDFGFILRDTRERIIIKAINRKPTKVHVISKDIPIEIIDEKARVQNMILNLQVW